MDKVPDYLSESATIQEQPFTSHTPLIGPVLVGFRSLWNSVATKWYVRAIIQQQNHFNHLLVTQLQEAEKRLLMLDRQNSQLQQQVAILSARLQQLEQHETRDA